MSVFDFDPNFENEILDRARANPLDPNTLHASWYEGIPTGIYAGAQRSLAKQTISAATDNDSQDVLARSVSKLHQYAPDPKTTGVAGNLLGVVTEMGTDIVGAVLGGNITPQTMAMEFTKQGGAVSYATHPELDEATRQQVARTEGTIAGLGAVIPMSVAGGLPTRAISGGIGFAGFGAAGRGVVGAELDNAGYHDMAQQYKALDASSIATDFVLGAAFGGLLGHRPKREVRPSDVDAALTANNASHIELDTAPGIPADPQTRQAHVDAVNAHLDAMLRDETPPMPPDEAVNGNFVPNPAAEAARQEIGAAVAEHVGPLDTLKSELEARGLPTDENLYSRGTAVGDGVEKVTQAAREAFGDDTVRLVDSGAIQVVERSSDLPARPDGQPHPADAKGYFDGERVYLVGENLSAGETKGVILHEVGAHVGMEKMLGAELYGKLTQEVADRGAAGEADFAEALRQVPADTPAGKVKDEALAYLVESRPELPLVKRIISAIKAALYRLFNGRLIKLNADDIRSLAVSALRRNSREQARSGKFKTATGSVSEPGRIPGGSGVLDAEGRTDLGNDRPLANLPGTVKVDGREVTFGPFAPARDAARRYAQQAGLDYNPPTEYVKVDPERATRIAAAFDAMAHDPNDPRVKASYDAMISETVAQWNAIKETGLKVEFIYGPDPYGNPRNAILDVVNNNHLWVYPTDAGFGGSESLHVDISGNPLLRIVKGETISGKPVRANDIFRIVHDYFGHVKEGVGFRADGEENAWLAHAAMYSDLARGAMTTETRGQNSWVNYGPFGLFNKTANGGETQYAPQKIGLLPDWVMNEGRSDAGGLYSRGANPGVESPGVDVAQENKNGFEPNLRVKVPLGKVTLPKKPLVLTGTNMKNAERQIEGIDETLAKFPNADKSPLEWSKMMAYAMATDDVPIPPYRFLQEINSDGAVNKLKKLTSGQIADADHGFENAALFRDAYTSGKLRIETTGKLFMWSFLSRGVSPYTQEGLFIDAYPGVDKWISKAAAGELTEADFPAYEAWAKSVAPKGSGQPGSGATHNLNAFGKLFLFKMGQKGEDGKSKLQHMHEMMSDPNMTGQDIRRWFITNTQGVGIDNKVVSFTLLVAGFPDVMVLDRVQIRQLWDDGRFADRNLYDGENYSKVTLPDGSKVKIEQLESESDPDFKTRVKTEVDKLAKEFGVTAKDIAVDRVKIAGSALSEITYGARGLLIYEAIERALAKRIENIYTALGRPDDASIGRYHWESWVADSQQEASHGTLDAILHDARGNPEMISEVTAKEGEYGAYQYGARYGRTKTGEPYFLYRVGQGQEHQFTVEGFRNFLSVVKSDKSGVIPKPTKTKVTTPEGKTKTVTKSFSVKEAGNAPWYERPEVNKNKLEELAAQYAVRPDQAGEGAVQTPGSGEAVSDSAGRRDPYSAENVIANKPDLTVVADDGSEVSAGRALTQADAEIAKAQQDSQGFDAAVACALRG